MGIRHSAERVAFGKAADSVIKHLDKDYEKGLLKIVDLTETFAKDRFTPESYASVRKAINEPDNKWMQYTKRIFNELSPNVIRTTMMNLGFEAMLSGRKIMYESREKYQCNVHLIESSDHLEPYSRSF